MSESDSSEQLQQSVALASQEQAAPEQNSLAQLMEGLSASQQAALGALAGRQTFSSAAAAAGVTRVTLWRWLETDRPFAEAYRQWKLEMRESSEAQLLMLGEQAVATVARATEAGDAEIALAIVREMGLLRSAGRCADPADQPIE